MQAVDEDHHIVRDDLDQADEQIVHNQPEDEDTEMVEQQHQQQHQDEDGEEDHMEEAKRELKDL